MTGLLGPDGRPISAASQTSGVGGIDPGLSGGWIKAGGSITSPTSISQILGQPIYRVIERTAARLAYFRNPLVYGGLEMFKGMLLGDSLSYGELSDDRAQAAWAEFWEFNELHEMAERYLTEYMVDGENIMLWPTDSKDLRRRRDQPALVGMYDVARGWEYETAKGRPDRLVAILTDDDVLYEQGQFVFTGNMAGYWNDPRGWPAIMQAVPPALSYINFVNHRIRIHAVQSRINAIYKTFIDPNKYPTAADQTKILKDRAAAFGQIPEDGAVVTLQKDPRSGESEDFELPSRPADATDSAEDGRLIRMLFGVALNLPLFMLGDGEDPNRSTSRSQLQATIMSMRRRQQVVWRWCQKIGRAELVRRYGPAQTYEIKKREMNGPTISVTTTRVTAGELELPVSLPEINDETVDLLLQSLKYARQEGWVSDQTGAAQLGYDLLEEREKQAAGDSGEAADPGAESDQAPDQPGGPRTPPQPTEGT